MEKILLESRILQGFFTLTILLKSSRNKKDLNDVTAVPFLVSFSQLPAVKKNKNGVAVTLLRSFLFRDDFNQDLILACYSSGFLTMP